MNNEALFKNLKNLRTSHKMTQDDIAEILGKDRSLIAKYESGKAVPPLDVLRVLAKLYNVSVDSLCGGVEGTDDTLVLNSDSQKKDNLIYYPDLTKAERDIIIKLRLLDEDKLNEIIESLNGLE